MSFESIFKTPSKKYLKFLIFHFFFKVIDLPQHKVWKLPSLNVLQSYTLLVKIRSNGFFYKSQTDYLPLFCVITRRGYLIIYTEKSPLKGHAVKLSTANKIQFVSRKNEHVRLLIINKPNF